MKDYVAPGIHPSIDLSRFTSEEKLIIHKLAEEWYITNPGTEIQLSSSSTYRYILAKPTSRYQQMFSLERELLVLFSPYERFEPRTLEAIERAYTYHQGLRIERICSILISKATDIESKLGALLRNDQEAQVIIPFTYDELATSTDPYFMRNRFRKHFFTRNLFALQDPLKKEYFFFGMNEVVHTIIDRHRSGQNSSLFGLRKSGKTSVVYGIERTLGRIEELAFRVDCQNTSFHRRRWNAALYYIISEMVQYFQIKVGVHNENEYTEENAAKFFEIDLVRIYRKLGKKSILLIFDEIENITFNVSPSSHWAEELDFIFFWQTLRSLYQKMDNVFTYLIVGTNAMCVEVATIKGKDNPIFNQVPANYIPQFDVGETTEMVGTLGGVMGLDFEKILYSRLTEDFGGHPFLIRHVCSSIHNLADTERPALVGKPIYEDAKQHFQQEHASYIEMILSVLQEHYNDEYEMLKLLAQGDVKTFQELAALSPNYTNHLLGYGIIAENGSRFYFKIEAVRDYLAAKEKYVKLHQTPLERWKEISERRNLLEPKLRLIVRNQLRAHLGKSEATQAVLNILGDPRKTRYIGQAYETLFDATRSEIYFEDLRKLMMKYWDAFQHIFGKDKADFDTKLKTINKFRSDAHAKNISDLELSHLRMCFEAVEKQVSEFLD